MIKKFLTLLVVILFLTPTIVAAQEETPSQEPSSEPAAPPAEPTPPPESPPQEPTSPPAPTPQEPLPTPLPTEPLPPLPQPQPPTGEPSPPTPQPSQPPQQPREGCWVGEQRVPCPGEVGQGCTSSFNSQTGLSEVICEKPQQPTCPPFPQDAVKKCEESGGRVNEFRDPAGCPRIECSYGKESGGFGGSCPPLKEIEDTRKKCEANGMRLTVVEEFGCKIARCEGREDKMPGQECHRLSPQNELTVKQKCKEKEGHIIQEFDDGGCVYLRCSEEIEGFEEMLAGPRPAAGESCKNDVPKEAYTKCEAEGGKLVIQNDQQGCIIFAKCIKRGESSEINYEFVDEVPPVTILVEIAFKLEEIKINFDKLSKKAGDIANYYKGTGDEANAKKFETVAGMFESAKSKIAEIETKLRGKVKTLTPEDIMDFKRDLKYITQVIMEDIAYVMLGGVESITQETATTPQPLGEGTILPSTEGCGTDFRCFEKSLRICTPTTFSPGPNSIIHINGLKDKRCILEAKEKRPNGNELTMTCEYADYAFGDISQEAILPHCKGELAEAYKREGSSRQSMPPQQQDMQPPSEEIMGCEKVARGMAQKDVCGNECCEPNIAEDYQNCPRDCMSPQQQPQREMAPPRQPQQQQPQYNLNGWQTLIASLTGYSEE